MNNSYECVLGGLFIGSFSICLFKTSLTRYLLNDLTKIAIHDIGVYGKLTQSIHGAGCESIYISSNALKVTKIPDDAAAAGNFRIHFQTDYNGTTFISNCMDLYGKSMRIFILPVFNGYTLKKLDVLLEGKKFDSVTSSRL